MIPSIVPSLTAAFLGACALTAWMRRVAVRHSLIDVPNRRSSHATPTPRAGGVSIVAVVSLATAILGYRGTISPWIAVALLFGGLAVALVGFIDDRRHLSAAVRLGVHVAAGIWVMICLSRSGSMYWPVGETARLAFIAASVLWIAWNTNLYNFMDGIDGLAASQAVTVGAGAGAVLLATTGSSLWVVLFTIAAASLGFLVWNWSPARIFMGDVGSGFLGFLFGSIAVISTGTGSLSIWVWPILMAVFLVDTTVTLLRRWARRERITEAHRTHAYQHAAIRLRRHDTVTLAVVGINLGWLLPLAFLAASTPGLGLPALLLAVAPLLGLAVWLRAGVKA